MRVRSMTLLGALSIVAACTQGDEALGPGGGDAVALDRGGQLPEGGNVRRYHVTIENLTSGQPLSPGVVVTHRPSVALFMPGMPASAGIQAIAEDGDPSSAAGSLSGAPGFSGVVATVAPVFQIGGPGPSALTLEIDAGPGANRLSLALMLICSNDGFAGLRSVELPADRVTRVFYAPAYDAGTEANDETSPTIVDPCFAIGPVPGPVDGNARVGTGGVVLPHAGIVGGADLAPAAHGWNGPVARVTVRRIG